MRTNYILIDFENVQPANLAILNGHPFKVLVFVGANQSKISFELAASIQMLGNDAEYVKMDGNGPNALDFHIAFYILITYVSKPVFQRFILHKQLNYKEIYFDQKTVFKWISDVCQD
ncbi:MAG: PIN domain-containing protein, partial [Pseudomonadota bacterium]|nr:PIN domain-containing protein [Pseudomonadota bacterium]